MTTTKTFKVEGAGRFPIDMLRHDCAWPQQGEDAAKIESPPTRLARYEVTLDTSFKYSPNVARWNSFGWRVTEIDRRPIKT